MPAPGVLATIHRWLGSEDVFVHQSAIVGEGYRGLSEGAKVTYETESGPKGLKAANVQTS